MTRFLQPLDIGVNKPFKDHMKYEYLKYIAGSFNGNKNKIEEKFNIVIAIKISQNLIQKGKISLNGYIMLGIMMIL